MNERFERAKEWTKAHLSKHKTLYLCGLTSVGTLAVAGITITIMRRVSGGCAYSQWEEAVVHTAKSKTPVSIFSNSGDNSFTNSFNNVINLDYGNRVTKMVGEVGSDRRWPSQADAARAIGCSTVNISKHLNHGEPIPGQPDLQLVRIGYGLLSPDLPSL